MSKYPDWWDSTITIYNKSVNPQTRVVTWHRTVLTNCFWKLSDSITYGQNSISDTESVICRIPQQSTYLSPNDWTAIASLSADKISNYFTLQPQDIIVNGVCDFVIDEYTAKQRSTDLLAKYSANRGCCVIKFITINTHAGLLTPHYLVKGA